MPYGFDRKIVYVLSVNEKRSVRNVVCAQNKVGNRGFSRSRSPRQTNAFARIDFKRNVFKHNDFGIGICKIKMFKLYIAFGVAEFDRTFSVLHVLRGIEKIAYALKRRLPPRPHSDKIGNCHNGPYDCRKIPYKFDKFTRVERTFENEISAESENYAYNRLDKQRYRYIQHR